MGEYANYRGQHIKIGTCEDMYYLRADQRHLINGYSFTPDVDRYRFPFPDEDSIEPGHFEDYSRGAKIPGWEIPAEWADDHGIVQFVASAGYNVCLPCPEKFGPRGLGAIEINGMHVHRNGFNGQPCVVQQAYRDGVLATIVACGSCGAKWRLARDEAEKVAQAFRDEAERKEAPRGNGVEWVYRYGESYRAELNTIADRIMDGYAAELAAAV